MASLFFGVLVLLGVACVRDYGMSWDEPADRLNAFVTAKYVVLRLAPELAHRQPRLADIPDLHQHRDADHGVLFMLPWVALESLWPNVGPTEWAFWRHLAGYLLFVAGAWAVYCLARERLGSWSWGLVAAGLLVLSPRIFAEAFYNYKDIVFLSLFALAMLTLTRLLRRPTTSRAALHALATAMAIDVRSMGVVVPLLTLGFMGLEMLYRPGRRCGFAGALVLYMPLAAGLVVLGWPYLWEAPLPNLKAALSSFSQYAKPLEVFYLGRYVRIQDLPWHYAPVWILITTPLVQVVLFLVGLGAIIRAVWAGYQRWLRRTAGRRDLLALAWFGGPLLGVMLLHSALYDGWRHLYFVWPALVLVGVQGLRALWHAWRVAGSDHILWHRAVAGCMLLVLAAGAAQVGWRMVREHPFQYAYFSFLPGKTIEQNFERDYWGLSTKQGLEWVLAHDARPVVSVGMDERTALTLLINWKMLPAADRARLRIAPAADAEYYFSIHRWHPGPYPLGMGRPVHVIRVGGVAILTVLRRS